MNKRHFLKRFFALGLGTSFFPAAFAKHFEKTTTLGMEFDDFWKNIRNKYHIKADYINLENGFYCIMPQPILDAQLSHLRELNYQGSYYMRTTMEQDKKAVCKRLAALADCSDEELVITRNTTESLDLVISGFPWKKGDEAVMAEQDYGAMLNQFKLEAQRHGIVNKIVNVPINPQSDEEVVKVYEEAITPKTKLLMVCHLINITGHILPIRKICDMAHKHGVEVLVDGAHAFAHIPVSMKDLDCDYYGTSLHKWMNAPLGGGFLYIKKEKIKKILPLFAEDALEEDNIYRLNHTGTTPVHTIMGINDAIDFHLELGATRKEERLRFLQNYWTDQLRNIPNIYFNTPEQKERSCAIANVGIKGYTPQQLSKTLFEKYHIWTVAIDIPTVKGCRITPNIYTTTEELDELVFALKELGK